MSLSHSLAPVNVFVTLLNTRQCLRHIPYHLSASVLYSFTICHRLSYSFTICHCLSYALPTISVSHILYCLSMSLSHSLPSVNWSRFLSLFLSHSLPSVNWSHFLSSLFLSRSLPSVFVTFLATCQCLSYSLLSMSLSHSLPPVNVCHILYCQCLCHIPYYLSMSVIFLTVCHCLCNILYYLPLFVCFFLFFFLSTSLSLLDNSGCLTCLTWVWHSSHRSSATIPTSVCSIFLCPNNGMVVSV